MDLVKDIQTMTVKQPCEGKRRFVQIVNLEYGPRQPARLSDLTSHISYVKILIHNNNNYYFLNKKVVGWPLLIKSSLQKLRHACFV